MSPAGHAMPSDHAAAAAPLAQQVTAFKLLCRDPRSIQADDRHEVARTAAVALLARKPEPRVPGRGASPAEARPPPEGAACLQKLEELPKLLHDASSTSTGRLSL